MKHSSTYCLQADSELILRDIKTVSVHLLSSGDMSQQEPSVVWFGLVWSEMERRLMKEVRPRNLLLGSGEIRRGLKRCSSLTLMKLIFTPFLKINEIICVVVFSHQSRQELLLSIVKYCGRVMKALLEIGLLWFQQWTCTGDSISAPFNPSFRQNFLSFYLPFSYVFRISLVLSWIPVTCFLLERERNSGCAVEQTISC